MATQLSSTSISHHNLLPHIPLICLSLFNSSPRPGIAPQSLNSSSQLLCFQGTCVPVQDMYGCGKDCLILIPFRLPQMSCFTLSLTQTVAPMWVLYPCFSSHPPAEGRSSPTNTPVFPPSSFILPSFAWLCIFFSAGQVLLSTLS